MSVVVQGLSKMYGMQKAVDDITFDVSEGTILGFLGPNGAGKSTTMKMLTGYIPPSSGTASVQNYDIITQSIEARRQIGYLPESNPLYYDMYVKEYLNFVGRCYKMSRDILQNRVLEMIGLTGLQSEQNKKIGQLSKGYKQRVGLAQAMIHDPKVLILDEPTSGLDPNQLADIRKLIKDLGKDKTIIFSTHIMQEVEAVCDRVLIISKGKIVADEGIEQLKHRSTNTSAIVVRFDKKIDIKSLESLQKVQKVVAVNEGEYKIYSTHPADTKARLMQFALDNGVTISSLYDDTQSMEHVFRELTK